ncbi:hypothetical protein BMF94_2025 [Rhodotorula taiwanensis]|uniref:Uncharacterized protein n=1 Tax=Rhodotorula taiwanensis TaxID=741276 RepID=A0A2S5BE60_9BASI|nr:hypothetical protein BMF94_2025 [Rhodotorula taiwanensis]
MPIMWEYARVVGHDEKLATLATVLELRGPHVRALALVLPWESSRAFFDSTIRCLRLCGHLTRINVMSTIGCRGLVAALRDELLAVITQVAPNLRHLDLALDNLDDTCADKVASISSACFDLHTTLGTFASSLQRLQLVVDSIPPTAARPDPLTFPHLSELWLRGHCASLIALFDACPALRILHAVTPNVIDAFDGSHFLDALRELRTRRSLPSLSSVKFRIVPIYVSTFDEIGIRSRFDGQLYDDIEEERKALGQVWGTMRDVEVQIEQDYVLCPDSLATSRLAGTMASFQLPPVPAVPTSGPELGAVVLGTVFTLVLAGLATVQTLDYLTCAFFIAPTIYLGLAVVLLAAGLLQASLSFYTLWASPSSSQPSIARHRPSEANKLLILFQLWFVQGYGNVLALGTAPWSYIWSIFLLGFVVSKAVQRFKGLIFAGFAAIATFLLVLAIIASVKIDRAAEDWTSFETYRWLLITLMWALTFVSSAATACLIFIEAVTIRESAGPDKSSPFSRICAPLYSADLIGSLVAFVDAVLVSALPFRGWHNILFLPLIQLYISAVVTSLEHAYNVELEALEAATSTSPSSGLHNSHLRSDRQRGLEHSVSRSGHHTTEILECEVETEAKKDSSTQNGSTTEVGSVSEKDSITASPTFALRSVITHCEPVRIPNHPYAFPVGQKEQSPTGRHPYASPAHEND